MNFTFKNKNFKKILFVSIICCLITIVYFFFFSNRVQIEVYNKTNFDIDSLNIDNKFYKIPKQKSLIINCRKILIQNNLPFGSPKGFLKDLPRDTLPEFLCGTGIEKVTSGKYKFDIKAFIGKDYYALQWNEHK